MLLNAINDDISEYQTAACAGYLVVLLANQLMADAPITTRLGGIASDASTPAYSTHDILSPRTQAIFVQGSAAQVFVAWKVTRHMVMKHRGAW